MALTRIFNVVPPTDALQGNQPVFTASTWCQITALKESSGVVAMGDSPKLTPFAQGSGMQLPVDQPVTFLMAPGSSLYLASTTAERVSIIVQDLSNLLEFFKSTIDSVSATIIKTAGKTPAAVKKPFGC